MGLALVVAQAPLHGLRKVWSLSTRYRRIGGDGASHNRQRARGHQPLAHTRMVLLCGGAAWAWRRPIHAAFHREGPGIVHGRAVVVNVDHVAHLVVGCCPVVRGIASNNLTRIPLN